MNRAYESSSVTAPIESVAADWLVKRHAGLDADETARMNRWLEQPEHAKVFRQLESSWQALNAPRFSGQADAFAGVIGRRRRAKRIRAVTGLGLAAAAAVAVFLGVWPAKQAPITAAPTVSVRPDRQVLPDGSTVELNAGAEIAVDFRPETRGVRLLRGEALFQVAKNPNRPFIVTAGSVNVRAVGTAFTVDLGAKQVEIIVTEGRVGVERAEEGTSNVQLSTLNTQLPTGTSQVSGFRSQVFLNAGNSLVISTTSETVSAPPVPVAVNASELAAALAWRGRRVEFTDTPLAEAIELFNHQNRVQLTSAGLEGLRLNGIFWSDDPESFVRLLEGGMGVRATRHGEQIELGPK